MFLFEKFEIQTKLSNSEILKKVNSFLDFDYTDYYGSVSENGFLIVEKYMKQIPGGHSHNSLAPIAKAKIIEKDGLSTVSVVLKPNIIVLILFASLNLISLLSIVLFPLMLLFVHFAFVKPAKRLRGFIEDLLTENGYC